VCRTPPLTNHFSVSPLEKSDAQILLARGRVVPVTDTDNLKASDDLRHEADTRSKIKTPRNDGTSYVYMLVVRWLFFAF
jgi:hypothetical protein